MQPKAFQQQNTDDPFTVGITDSQDFDVEHLFYMNAPDCTRVLQLSNNCVDSKWRIDCSQTSGSCPCCTQGQSLVPRLGFDKCSSTASSFKGHKSQSKGNGALQEVVLESTAGSEDHCTCNKYVNISCSHSVSSAGSSVLYDDENALELPTSVLNQAINHEKDLQLSQGYASRVEELQLDLLQCALEYEVKVYFFIYSTCSS
ncbi:hypothetical protein L7F22_035372 [Adiantum nelumboides]|nr:hypothetical protein [Adiantum nelumboides]